MRRSTNACDRQATEESVSAWVPGLPGCWSEGATEAEALTNIKEAIVDYLEIAANTHTIEARYVSGNSAVDIASVADLDHIDVGRLIVNTVENPVVALSSPKEVGDCRDTVFEVQNIVRLNTAGLQGKPFDWRQYGGPLAILKLCRFVRFEILRDSPPPRKMVPLPRNIYHQQGDLILQKIDEIPPGAIEVVLEPRPDGSLDLGDGYIVRNTEGTKGE